MGNAHRLRRIISVTPMMPRIRLVRSSQGVPSKPRQISVKTVSKAVRLGAAPRKSQTSKSGCWGSACEARGAAAAPCAGRGRGGCGAQIPGAAAPRRSLRALLLGHERLQGLAGHGVAGRAARTADFDLLIALEKLL